MATHAEKLQIWRGLGKELGTPPKDSEAHHEKVAEFYAILDNIKLKSQLPPEECNSPAPNTFRAQPAQQPFRDIPKTKGKQQSCCCDCHREPVHLEQKYDNYSESEQEEEPQPKTKGRPKSKKKVVESESESSESDSEDERRERARQKLKRAKIQKHDSDEDGEINSKKKIAIKPDKKQIKKPDSKKIVKNQTSKKSRK
jgi:hypothetical protein